MLSIKTPAAFTGLVVSIAAVGLAAPAKADQYDYVSALDSNGVYYGSILDVIDLGKLTCRKLRMGDLVTGVAFDVNGRGVFNPLSRGWSLGRR
jgi:hypothetical protein